MFTFITAEELQEMSSKKDDYKIQIHHFSTIQAHIQQITIILIQF